MVNVELKYKVGIISLTDILNDKNITNCISTIQEKYSLKINTTEQLSKEILRFH